MSVEQIGDYEVFTDSGSSLGQGTFGFVTKGQHKETKELVAIKRIDEKRISKANIDREIQMMKLAAGNEHILKLFYHTLKNGYMWLVVEYCEGGDLNSFLFKNILSERVARQVVLQCVAGISHLHGMKPHRVVHRDVKPQNYLVTFVDDKMLVKVCDFGVSTTIPDASLYRLNTDCGSLDYKAPELFQDYVSYTMDVDVFAVGMVIWAMVHREPKCGLKALTFGNQCLGMRWLIERATKGETFNPFPVEASSDGLLKSLAIEMMSFVPKSRPSISHVHRIVRGHINDMEGQENDIEQLRSKEKETAKFISENARIIHELDGLKDENEQLRKELAEMRSKNTKTKSDMHDLNSHQQELHGEFDNVISKHERLEEQMRDMSLDCKTQNQDTLTSQAGATSIAQREGTPTISAGRLSPGGSGGPGSPVIISTAPSVRKLGRVKLPYTANVCIGVSKRGFVLEVGNELCRWEVQGGVLKEAGRVKSRWAVEVGCYKYELPDGRWAFQCYTLDPTYILSPDMTQVLREHSGEYGHLRGVVHDAFLYVKEYKYSGTQSYFRRIKHALSGAKYELSLYSVSDHAPVATLPLCVGGYRPSVCVHPGGGGGSSGHFAVSDWHGQTLDVYSSPAAHTHRRRLGEPPSVYNSVAATDQVIVVAQGYLPGLSVHAWDGRQLGEVGREEMGVKEGRIHGVGIVDGKVLVAAGDWYGAVTALYLLELS